MVKIPSTGFRRPTLTGRMGAASSISAAARAHRTPAASRRARSSSSAPTTRPTAPTSGRTRSGRTSRSAVSSPAGSRPARLPRLPGVVDAPNQGGVDDPADADFHVSVNGATLVLDTDYTVTGGGTSSGTINFSPSLSDGDFYVITSDAHKTQGVTPVITENVHSWYYNNYLQPRLTDRDVGMRRRIQMADCQAAVHDGTMSSSTPSPRIGQRRGSQRARGRWRMAYSDAELASPRSDRMA